MGVDQRSRTSFIWFPLKYSPIYISFLLPFLENENVLLVGALLKSRGSIGVFYPLLTYTYQVLML